MENLDKVLAKVTEALANLAAQHGTDVVMLAGSVLQIKAIVLLAIGIVLIGVMSFFLKKGLAYANTCEYKGDIGPAKTVMFMGWLILVVPTGIATILNPMNWVSAISPYHAIAVKIIGML